MIQSPNVRRRPDGSIDFDFYRRRAARQRRVMMRLTLRHWSFAITRLVVACPSTIQYGAINHSLKRFGSRDGLKVTGSTRGAGS
jgi:hypothetical protein